MPYDIWSGLTLVSPPTAAPVSVADAKAHSRVYTEMDDALIAGYIYMATMACEDRCRRAFMPQTWKFTLNNFPGRSPSLMYREAQPDDYWKFNFIDIPKPPLISVVSFTYMDTMGNVYVMQQGYGPQVGNYLLDTDSEPGRVVLPFSGIWPTTILLPTSPIQITYRCGFPAYSLQVSVDQNGLVTLPISSPQLIFDSQLIGTYVTLNVPPGAASDPTAPTAQTGSYNVASISDDGTQMQLVVPQPNPVAFPQTAATLTGNNVPMPIRSAVLFMAAHLYENREPVVTGRAETAIEIPSTVDAMLCPYKIFGT